MFPSILLATLLAIASAAIDPLLVKAILLLLGVVILMGGTLGGERQ
jgi:hypothetical protein